MRELPVKKTLYWCDQCDIPLLGKLCGCGATGRSVPLLQPYDLRPVLTADGDCLTSLVRERFGDVPLPQVMLLNKTGGLDRNDLVIIHGERFGWFSFDPADRRYTFDISPDALPFVVPYATKGIVDLETSDVFGDKKPEGRIGGKKFKVTTDVSDGTVIIRYKNKYGTGVVKDGYIRIKELMPLKPGSYPDPGWDFVIHQNRYHLKNIERNAIRTIRQHMHDRPRVNVSFSGGKDSTAVLALARKAGVTDAFFIDSSLEIPDTITFVREQGVPVISGAGDFWKAVQSAGPPGKDYRWCCKLLKLNPLKAYLAEIGPCVTIQGNRWYESWNRAGLAVSSQNPDNPLQVNISPIRNWRALEVYLYLWWRKIPINPLYEKGLERIGCYLCPAVLESESELIRKLYPDMTLRWEEFLNQWVKKEGLPPEYATWGLWRWKELPAKMKELCRDRGLDLKHGQGT
ncbi:MAG: phosphoadenosine phosphosulfate reductase family protein [Methanospirillaceae archaeon]|nr:phosphoadenosine phosphosulfate reductase family protein [Methanospirillaceae archaeon]